ncbi:apoptosis-associated speck-like protein containing a CARD [Scleropages formosus]|uniref:PYD and CARD domain containing n=1 Tax=Scleropages formosus TaxID=113540 RepID=A0A8C9S865_SCLFO|nr:apoptosis-associated speck-like protein containing a CARD [Scleropages formosus]
MSKTVKDCLIEVLDDLDDDQFKKFKSKLVDRREEPRIRRGTIMTVDRLDVADKLVSTFTEEGASRVAVEILEFMGCRQEVEDLKDSLKKVSVTSGGRARDDTGTSPVSAGDSKFMVNGRHFVDYHRNALIQRVCQVDSILDCLLEKDIVNQENYSFIRAQSTEQMKMRELFSGPLNSCGNKGKDEFYFILEKQQPHLIEDLKRS